VVVVKKSTGGGGDESLDILAARLRIVEAELTLEEREVKLDNGRTFMAEPNLNVKVEVVENMVDPGVDEGVRFYDRFKLKKDDDGDWSFARYGRTPTICSPVQTRPSLRSRSAAFGVSGGWMWTTTSKGA
jgi:hypothetical protein